MIRSINGLRNCTDTDDPTDRLIILDFDLDHPEILLYFTVIGHKTFVKETSLGNFCLTLSQTYCCRLFEAMV